jgi:broad specificity phosphatase PhoE
MSDTVLHLIRHGETDYNLQNRIQGRGINAPLNEAGIRQAVRVGAWLKREGVDAVYSSSMVRARQTAAFAMGMAVDEVTADADLDELSYGAMEGILVDEQIGDLAELYAQWDAGNETLAPVGGESPVQVRDRAMVALYRILERHKGERVAIVTHGRVLRILIAHLTGMGLTRMHDVLHANGCIYTLRYDGTTFHPDLMFHTDHLEEPINS